MSTATKRTHKKVGLALGGGGAKGLAHIGVIKELERAGLEIGAVAGTSMGAIVGSWYAATKDIATLEKLFLGVKPEDITPMRKLARNRDGAVFKDGAVPKFLEAHLDGISFEKCKIPFVCIATDVKNGDEAVLSEGKLVPAVRASSSLPVVSSPVEIEGRLLMDGGFVNPVPADALKKMGCDFIIAVDVSSKWLDLTEEKLSVFHLYSLISSALSVVEYQVARRILENADVVLKPQVLGYDWLAFGSAKELIRLGEEEAHAQIEKICRDVGHVMPEKSLFEKFMDFILYSE